MANSETIIHAQQADIRPPEPDMPDPEAIDQGIANLEQFLGENSEHLGRIFGITNLTIRIGKGWVTDMESGEVTADPRFFIEKGYSPDMAAWATMHEVAAHLKEVVEEPKLTRDVIDFLRGERYGTDSKEAKQRGEAASIFHNILSDIAGNNQIAATLPAAQGTAQELYDTKLFVEADFTQPETLQPRHLQFLYKIIRQEMISSSETIVYAEVDEAITKFREFRPTGASTSIDLIALSTAVAQMNGKEMPARDRFNMWTNIIYPTYTQLFELDREDPQFQKQPPQEGESGEPQKGEPGEPGEPSDTDDTGESQGKTDFSEFYDDYHENRHPEPFSEEQEKEIQQTIQKQEREKERAEREARNPLKQFDKDLQEKIGHTLAELQKYQREVQRWAPQIQAMRDIYKLVINERVSHRRRLRGSHTEGALINPETLAQTLIDVQAGVHEPAAFMDYERRTAERELSGKTDWVFVFDRSGSMSNDGRSQAAAATAVICLEGLAGMQRDIQEAEDELGTILDLDIRTALYTFNHEIECPKPLSHNLTEKERLDAYGLVANPGGQNADSVALEKVENLVIEADRRKVLVVVSDGEADDTAAARASVNRLRQNGWSVYGIAIGSEAAEKLYAPYSRRVDDPTKLPDAMQAFIESNLT